MGLSYKISFWSNKSYWRYVVVFLKINFNARTVKGNQKISCLTKNTPFPFNCSKGPLQRCPQAGVRIVKDAKWSSIMKGFHGRRRVWGKTERNYSAILNIRSDLWRWWWWLNSNKKESKKGEWGQCQSQFHPDRGELFRFSETSWTVTEFPVSSVGLGCNPELHLAISDSSSCQGLMLSHPAVEEGSTGVANQDTLSSTPATKS